MKRNNVIMSLFLNHEAKKKKIDSSSNVDAVVVEEHTQEQEVTGERGTEGSGNQMPPSCSLPVLVPLQAETEDSVIPLVASNPTPPQSTNASNSMPRSSNDDSAYYNVELLPHDPGKRMPIASYPINNQDTIRRGFIAKGPCQPRTHEFPITEIYGRNRHFILTWFDKYPWIEYSVEKDAAFCFVCYLFKEKSTGVNDNFVSGGWTNWNKCQRLDKHEGSIKSIHNQAQEKYNFFVKPNTSIANIVVRISKEDKRLYIARLTYSLRCLRFILCQGLAFRGHDEREQSSNRGNFLELLKWLADSNDAVDKVVLNNAPGNCILTCHTIQTEIIDCCAVETTRQIIEEIGDGHFAILADECSDVSHKEQLALCLRYVDKLGRVREHFLGIVHVADTTSLCLKEAIESLLIDHQLTLAQICGQGYDGASNMKGEVKGLKTLIMKESPSAYYIHCFAHQLQLVLVAVAKGNQGCVWFFDQLSQLLNIIGGSCKRHDMLRNVRAQEILKALEEGEIESGRGLNQEMGLARPGETRWGSHYRTIVHIITMYSAIRKVIIKIGKDPAHRSDWLKVHTIVRAFETFEFVFNAHLMLVILGYTDQLSQSLQKRDQDIVNAMALVNVAKGRMQNMRDHGWDEFLQKVVSFCKKHAIRIPKPDARYVPHARSSRFFPKQTIDDHYRREVYLGVIDSIRQELDNRFDEVNMELLVCVSALNPLNSFSSYEKEKVLKLAKFYSNDFSNADMVRLSFQLDNFIDDMRIDDRFKDLKNLVELSMKLVETRKDKLYKLVYLLLNLVLLLPVVTASVERVFSAMKIVKNMLRNSMGGQLLNDCLVTFIEHDIFLKVSDDDIVNTFMALKTRRVL